MLDILLDSATFSKNGVEQTVHGFTDGDARYELIQEIQVDEDILSTIIAIDKEPNGNPYSFKSVKVIVINKPHTANGDARFRFARDDEANGLGAYLQLRVCGTGDLYTSVECNVESGFSNVLGYFANLGTNSATLYTSPFIENRDLCEKITGVSIQVLTNSVIKSGATIKIYGIR